MSVAAMPDHATGTTDCPRDLILWSNDYTNCKDIVKVLSFFEQLNVYVLTNSP